jgi:hypothetical protein
VPVKSADMIKFDLFLSAIRKSLCATRCGWEAARIENGVVDLEAIIRESQGSVAPYRPCQICNRVSRISKLLGRRLDLMLLETESKVPGFEAGRQIRSGPRIPPIIRLLASFIQHRLGESGKKSNCEG